MIATNTSSLTSRDTLANIFENYTPRGDRPYDLADAIIDQLEKAGWRIIKINND